MRACLKCGGSLYQDADPYCVHDLGEAPEPEAYRFELEPTAEQALRGATTAARFEIGWAASGEIAGQWHRAEHPTRDGAVALWKERWTWGPAVAALFGWLHGPVFTLLEPTKEEPDYEAILAKIYGERDYASLLACFQLPRSALLGLAPEDAKGGSDAA